MLGDVLVAGRKNHLRCSVAPRGCGSSLQPGPAPLAAPTCPAGDVALLFIAFFYFFSFHIISYLSNKLKKKEGERGFEAFHIHLSCDGHS